jgi:hypothetical protein
VRRHHRQVRDAGWPLCPVVGQPHDFPGTEEVIRRQRGADGRTSNLKGLWLGQTLWLGIQYVQLAGGCQRASTPPLRAELTPLGWQSQSSGLVTYVPEGAEPGSRWCCREIANLL